MLRFPSNDPRIEALKQDKIVWAPIVQIDFSDGLERLSPATASDIRVDGNVYMSDTDLFQLSPVSASRTPSRDLFDVGFFDPVHPSRPTRWVDKFTKNGYVGIPITVGMSFFYNESWTDSITIYKGKCVEVISTVDENNGQVTITEFAGPLTKLDVNSPLKLTKANLAQRNSSDTFLNYIAISRDLQFGKKVS